MTTPIDYKSLTIEQLTRLRVSDNALLAEKAKIEIDRRTEDRKYIRAFFFPNLWAVLGLLLALYLAFGKNGT